MNKISAVSVAAFRPRLPASLPFRHRHAYGRVSLVANKPDEPDAIKKPNHDND
jgi:hypothetical protein